MQGLSGLSGLTGLISSVSQAGPRSPGTASNVSLGAQAWTDPDNVMTSNDAWAACPLDGSQSDELRVTNFGFSIPAGATILGIELRVERSMTPLGGEIRDLSVRLRKAAGAVGDNKASAGLWPDGTDAIATYGGPTDLWGTTWSPADINDSGFGAAIRAEEAGVNPMTAQVDHITLTVYHA